MLNYILITHLLGATIWTGGHLTIFKVKYNETNGIGNLKDAITWQYT